jgi:hypothetical protein
MTPANIDRIKPLVRFWSKRLEPSNFQLLCDRDIREKGNKVETDFRSEHCVGGLILSVWSLLRLYVPTRPVGSRPSGAWCAGAPSSIQNEHLGCHTTFGRSRTYRPHWSNCLRGCLRAQSAATCADRHTERHEMLVTRLSRLSVAISLALVAPVAAQTGSIGAHTCAKWLDGREHQLSTTMETWAYGYLTSSNQWALALGLTAAPLLFPELLSLLDQHCKSTPNAYLANVVLDVIQSEFSRRNRARNEAPSPRQRTPKP